jgi:hypothetical protein
VSDVVGAKGLCLMPNAASSASNADGWLEFLNLFSTSNAGGLKITHVSHMCSKPTTLFCRTDLTYKVKAGKLVKP